ncbi:MAG: choice-of-anchor Q domain-containing protein [Myxococcota bacterium]|nr:choice-of-anchor Q domain-containing protein [Myxococcota bacterium]
MIVNSPSGGDCAVTGPITSHGHNLDSDGTCNLTEPSDLPNTDPFLGPLRDHGGPTLTHHPLDGSPAIDAIPVEECLDDEGMPLLADQRGVERPHGLGCDIGAVEYVPEPQSALLSAGAIGGLLGLRRWRRQR